MHRTNKVQAHYNIKTEGKLSPGRHPNHRKLTFQTGITQLDNFIAGILTDIHFH